MIPGSRRAGSARGYRSRSQHESSYKPEVDPPYDVILAVTSLEWTVREPVSIIVEAAPEWVVLLVDIGAANTDVSVGRSIVARRIVARSIVGRSIVASVECRSIAEGSEGQEGGEQDGRKDHLGRCRRQRI